MCYISFRLLGRPAGHWKTIPIYGKVGGAVGLKSLSVIGPHANDEDIGGAKPDKTYNRSGLGAACRKRHEEHVAKPEKLIARWIKIGSPKKKPVCTDCHGTHKIERPEPEETEKDDDATEAPDGKTEK